MFKIFNKLNITNIRSKHIESKILQMFDIYTKDEQTNSVFAIFVHHALLEVTNISFSTSTNNHRNVLMRTNY